MLWLFWSSLPPGALVATGVTLLAAALKAAATVALLAGSVPLSAAAAGTAVAAEFADAVGLLLEAFALLAAFAALPPRVIAGASAVFAAPFAPAVPGLRLARICDAVVPLCALSAVAVWIGVPFGVPVPGAAMPADGAGAAAPVLTVWAHVVLGGAPAPGVALPADDAAAGVPVLAGAADDELLADWGVAPLSGGGVC